MPRPAPDAPRAFPTTRWSLVGAADRDGAELRTLVGLYDRPIRAYLAARWSLDPHEAGDRAQDFFVKLLERDVLARADPARARFRTYVKAILDAAVTDEHRRRSAHKRGGGRTRETLDAVDRAGADAATRSPEEILDREWRRAVVARALDALQRTLQDTGHAVRFAVFESWYLDDEDVDHATLAERHGLRRHDVSNHLRLAKQRFRAIITELLRETVHDQGDLEAELAWFFGGRAP